MINKFIYQYIYTFLIWPDRKALRQGLSFSVLLSLLAGCGAQAPAPLYGYVEGEAVQVAAPIAGRMQAVHVVRGEDVGVAAPLFALESEREQAALQDVEQRVAAAQAQLERVTRLRPRGLASAEQIDAARTQLETALAQRVDVRWRLAQTAVAAPQAGNVQELYYRAGEWVSAGAPVVALLPPQNRKLRFYVPEPLLQTLRPGTVLRVRCDGCGEPFAARVSFVASEPEFTPPVLYGREQRARLVYRVEAQPDAAVAARLHPGQPVDIERVDG
jgi:HlyD family secretion protein